MAMPVEEEDTGGITPHSVHNCAHMPVRKDTGEVPSEMLDCHSISVQPEGGTVVRVIVLLRRKLRDPNCGVHTKLDSTE